MLRIDLPLLCIFSISYLASSLLFCAPSPRLHEGKQCLHHVASSAYHATRRGALFSSGKESSIAVSSLNSNVCIVCGGGDDDDDDDDHENAHVISVASAQEIANSLGVPLFSFAEWDEIVFGDNDRRFNHIMRLVPYKYNDDDGNILLSTYALAIEESPILATKPCGPASKRIRKKKLSRTPFFVDLCPPRASRAGRRVSGTSGTSDLLLKAVIPGKGSSHGQQRGATVYDLTAGFGQDSLVMALNGAHRVAMVERNPIVAALLQDALRRLELISKAEQELRRQRKQQGHYVLSLMSDTATILVNKLSLSVGEGRDFVEILDHDNAGDGHSADIIYLDPMFPPRQKSSAVKKGMQLLHGLLETQDDNSGVKQNQQLRQQERDLLQSAWKAAKLRVVVKRPIKAPPLGVEFNGNATISNVIEFTLKPSFTITGSVNRWDVYVKPGAPA